MGSESTLAVLKDSGLGDLEEDSLKLLVEFGGIKSFAKDEKVFVKDEPVTDSIFYVILSGQMDVMRDTGEVITTLARKEIVGETGLVVPGRKRSCTVVATEDVEVLEVDLKEIEEKNLALLSGIMERLEETVWGRMLSSLRH